MTLHLLLTLALGVGPAEACRMHRGTTQCPEIRFNPLRMLDKGEEMVMDLVDGSSSMPLKIAVRVVEEAPRKDVVVTASPPPTPPYQDPITEAAMGGCVLLAAVTWVAGKKGMPYGDAVTVNVTGPRQPRVRLCGTQVVVLNAEEEVVS